MISFIVQHVILSLGLQKGQLTPILEFSEEINQYCCVLMQQHEMQLTTIL